jgi:hypothetical protein
VIESGAVEVLIGGCGRGLTVLSTMQDVDVLRSLASIAGATGMVIAAGTEPAIGDTWQAVRCVPAEAIPVRSHVVDAAVIVETADLHEVAAEVRRALAPGGDLRVFRTGTADVEAALSGAAIRPLRQQAGVLIARGP